MDFWYALNILFVILFAMNLICPECKNSIDLSVYPDLSIDQIIECNLCGITLQVTAIEGEAVSVEIVDEGK